MSRFLVCSSALLGQPGCSGATEHLRDCTTGVATLLDDSPMESDNRNGQSAKNKPVISGCYATMARMGAEECLNRKSDQSALGSIPRRVIQFFNPISTCCAECSVKAEQPHGKYTWLTGSDGFP